MDEAKQQKSLGLTLSITVVAKLKGVSNTEAVIYLLSPFCGDFS